MVLPFWMVLNLPQKVKDINKKYPGPLGTNIEFLKPSQKNRRLVEIPCMGPPTWVFFGPKNPGVSRSFLARRCGGVATQHESLGAGAWAETDREHAG